MIDISGYSLLTSKLAEMGKVSSEIITQSVGMYLSELISIIYKYNGDIVKFLGFNNAFFCFRVKGDALLVTFAKQREKPKPIHILYVVQLHAASIY
ncbi:hypothetical protein BC829DRAFT_85222 [Chytridium lagenaria]|nr:hypothetical protein BC829DRAFT_85222 [Chytridium lagenaria]